MLEAQQERHATLSKTLDEHVKGKTMAEEEIKHLRQKLSVRTHNCQTRAGRAAIACIEFVDTEVQERDQDIDRADSMLRMMRQRELDRERERERERNREMASREKAKGIGSSMLRSVFLAEITLQNTTEENSPIDLALRQMAVRAQTTLTSLFARVQETMRMKYKYLKP